jgi:hypothetical protein
LAPERFASATNPTSLHPELTAEMDVFSVGCEKKERKKERKERLIIFFFVHSL